MTIAPAADILAFCFGRPGKPGHGQPRSAWFRKDSAFDTEIRTRFLAGVEAAMAGQRDDWAATPQVLFAARAGESPGNDGFLDYARRHHEVIARFGRFPHRNAALGRVSTPEEATCLAQPGSGF